jgi:hypothetical protein
MKTLREYIDIVETAQRDPFDFLSNQDLLSMQQSLDSDIKETTPEQEQDQSRVVYTLRQGERVVPKSNRDQTIDDIVSKLTPDQKKELRSKLNKELKQRKENPQTAQEVKPVKSSMLSKVIGSILIGSAILYAMPDDPISTPAAQTAPIPKHKQVEVVDFKWSRIPYGLTFDADFQIKNNLSVPVKDLKVRCDGYAESGTRIDRNIREIFRTIRPGETLVITDFNMGFLHSQVKTINCSIEDFQQIK